MKLSIDVQDRMGAPAYVVRAGGHEQWIHAAHLVENPHPRVAIVQMADNFEMLLGESIETELLDAFVSLKAFPGLDAETVDQLKALKEPPPEWQHVS